MAAGESVSASDADESHESAESSAAAYRPHLDGLRALAVYLVVLFHAGSSQFSGGFIGVDVFFVLSGFLVTQLLLRDLARGGSIRFGRFYSRRFRRLLPAAFVTLIVTAVVYTAIATPVDVSGAVASFKAAFLYSTNWYFVHQSTSYFGANIAANPVLHFWSLAVEEQFYLLWPLVLGGLALVSRKMGAPRQVRTMQIVVAAGALASVVAALSLRTSDPNRAYYGTDTRAYELLGGGLIALAPGLVDGARRFRRALGTAAAISVIALLALSSSLVNYDAIERGVAVTIATCILIVALEAADGGLMKRALSTRSMVYLGKISYGTYLWHWLVILVVLDTFHISTIATVGIACLVATALASLSFEMLERPIRISARLDRHRRTVIVSGLTVSVISALVLIPTIVDPAHATTPIQRNAVSTRLTPVPAGLDVQNARNLTPFHNCVGKPARRCVIVHGGRPGILLMGDSHAWMLIPLFREIAGLEQLRLSVSVLGGCPWQRDLYTPFKFSTCKREKEDLYKRVIPTLRPGVIVVMNLGYGTPGDYPAPLEDSAGRPAGAAAVARATRASVAALRAGGRQVLIIEPIPLPKLPDVNFDPRSCLSKAAVLEACRYEAFGGTSSLEQLYRDIATHDPQVHSLDLDLAVCPSDPICDPVVNGQIVKWDPSHLTTNFVHTLVPEVDLYLRRMRIIPR